MPGGRDQSSIEIVGAKELRTRGKFEIDAGSAQEIEREDGLGHKFVP
jgi:hypothetical protein